MRIIERHFTGEHGNSGISPMWFPANKSSSKPPSQWFFPSLSPKGRSNIGLPALSHSQTNPRGMLSWGGNELHVVNGSVHGKGIYTARISNPQQRAQLNGSTAQLDGGMEFQFFHFFSNPIGSMYGIYANVWGILMVNVTIYSIHGSYGNDSLEHPAARGSTHFIS